jgi:hypothetical protein
MESSEMEQHPHAQYVRGTDEIEAKGKPKSRGNEKEKSCGR